MFTFSEEGSLLEELSSDRLIPQEMNYKSVIAKRGKLFSGELFEVKIFDGVKWSLMRFNYT